MVSTIALGADHAGYGLKEALKGWLINHGYQVLDLGTHSTESVDYPDYAALVAESVADHKVERGAAGLRHRHRHVDRGQQGPGRARRRCAPTSTPRG